MSGSTENLLRNSHTASRESVDEHDHGADSRQKKTSKQGKTSGMENKGYLDDHRELGASSSSEIYIPNETQGQHKRATSFQQRPIASPTKETRRHSSPDYNNHHYQGRNRSRQGAGRHRLSSNSEEDLRRKACLNSMKGRRYQSANPLPSSREDEAFHSPSAEQDKGKQSYIEDERKRSNVEEHGSYSSSLHDTGNQRRTQQVSPHQHQDELRDMQTTVLALERSQLEQYKRRLTMALSERAKLTGELKFLSHSLSQSLENADEYSRESLPSSSRLERTASSTVSPRLSHSLSDLTNPELYRERDYDDYERNLCLPALPASANMEMPELDLASFNSSLERISSNNNKKTGSFSEDKADTEDTKSHQKATPEENKDQEEKEDLKKMVDDIWQDNLRGDVLAQERQEPVSEDDHTSTENGNGNADLNNNEKVAKKHLIVEEFLANEDLSEPQHENVKTQTEKEFKVLLDYENMNQASRVNSPDLYETLDDNDFGQQIPLPKPNTAVNDELGYKTPSNHGLLRLKDDEKSRGRQDDLESYFTASTLPVGQNESKKVKKTETLHGEPALDEHQPRTTRLQRNDRRFNYMTPPGTIRTNVLDSGNNDVHAGGRGTDMAAKKLQKPPSNISEKLHYYRQQLSNREEDDTSRDLADAFANEKNPEKRREIQQQAAGEAAILRREASALLWEAMNLERICDPNGRVRHVYLPQ